MNSWAEISRATNSRILAWAESQPWARAMASCSQDLQWHAEGDVWTHTRMVCDQLELLPDWPALDRITQLKLLFTALFHDSGKPLTTIFDSSTRRIRSPKHALASVEIARNTLRELKCDLRIREEIVALVRFHGRPPYLLEKERPERELISLSWQVSNRLLYLFALADTRGRRSAEMSRPEEILHLWKSVAEENKCFSAPFPFTNDHARFLFYRDKLSSLHYSPREDFRCFATLMAGLPGAGKDTWLRRFRPQLPVVSLDATRAELQVLPTDDQGSVIQAAREKCREYLRARIGFAFNATNITRQTRSRWIELFADYNARIEIVYFEPPFTVLFAQNKSRDDAVPEKVMLKLLEKLEPPSITECHALTLNPDS